MRAVDLFAGLGGFTEGAEMAGYDVVWAGNHNPPACATHAMNHPRTMHACQDLHQQDWYALPPFDVVLASPACQGHSPARGKEQPRHDVSRSTAWAVVACVEAHRPAAFVVENVPAFLNWTLFPVWQSAMAKLGFSMSTQILDAADHGVPQHRRRVFIIGTRSRSPFALKRVRREHVAFASVIDHESRGWSGLARKCCRTRARARNGRRQFGDEFLMPYYSSGSGLTGRSLNRPLGTVTTKDRWALVRGRSMRMLNVAEYRRVMGFREDYQLPPQDTLAKFLLGNAVCPRVAADVLTDLREHL